MTSSVLAVAGARLKKETKQYEDQVKGPVVDTAVAWTPDPSTKTIV